MKAEVITIGDEILIGQIVDTNSAFIAELLNKAGVLVHRKSTIPDEEEAIEDAVDTGLKRSDLLILTGGLGPTRDDKTKETLTTFFGDKLLLNQRVLDHIENLFRKYIGTPISEMNRRQAYLPSKARILFNPNGTAPGMWFEHGGKIVVSLPGVPFEMKHLLREEVLPAIRDQFELPFILHRTLITFGLGESAIAERIESFETSLPSEIKLAYLPSLGRVRLRLSSMGDDRQEVEQKMQKKVEELRELVSDIYYGEESEGGLEARLGNRLKERGLSLATAESFTGGQIARQIISTPGASAYFKGSVVAYATEAKIRVLEVPTELVEHYSVVSEEVAVAMAKNIRAMMQSDFAIATTGNAGPEKGDSEEEVGQVFIAISGPERSYATAYQMGKNRERITQKSVNKALEMIYQEILNF